MSVYLSSDELFQRWDKISKAVNKYRQAKAPLDNLEIEPSQANKQRWQKEFFSAFAEGDVYPTLEEMDQKNKAAKKAYDEAKNREEEQMRLKQQRMQTRPSNLKVTQETIQEFLDKNNDGGNSAAPAA